jgi:hypothetical protein
MRQKISITYKHIEKVSSRDKMAKTNNHYYNFSFGMRLKMAVGGGWASCPSRLMPGINQGGRFLLTEAVTRNRLTKSIDRGRHYNAPAFKNNLFTEAVILRCPPP